MAKMMNPELEVVRFENEDVISASMRVSVIPIKDDYGNVIGYTYQVTNTATGANGEFDNPNDAANYLRNSLGVSGGGSITVDGTDQTLAGWMTGISDMGSGTTISSDVTGYNDSEGNQYYNTGN